MLAKNAAKDVMAAVAVMEHARNACANLSPLGLPMSEAQIEHRARVIAAVINASRKLQQLSPDGRTFARARDPRGVGRAAR